MLGKKVFDMIGNTPLVEITRLNPNPRVRILAKIEATNPGGSIKDRIALSMIEAAERNGELTPDKTIIEATSGNTGIGLAIVAAAKGYSLLLVMAESVSVEKRKIIKALSADILLTPAHLSTDGAIEEAYRLAREESEKYFMPDQFNNPNNVLAHYHGTGLEIWEQTGGQVTIVVATMGTTGTLMGITRRLRELNPAVCVVGIEPYIGHKIQGLKNRMESYAPGIFRKEEVAEIVHIEDEEAFDMARYLARYEGLFVGMSSGAAMAVAREKAKELEDGLIVAILPDGGERYLSTSLFMEKPKATFKFFNTLDRAALNFEPIEEGKVSMYTCGPTVDGNLHIGDYRRYIVADLLRRFLESKGYNVRHVVNITNLDDRTIAAAERKGMEFKEFTEGYIQEFLVDMDELRVKRASEYPRVSDHIEDIIEMTGKLLERGAAYEKLRSVYFDISRFTEYGKLSGIDISKIKIGKTTELDNYAKDDPRDFTLLKRSTLAELKNGIFYKTRWGNVRPGWHIECPVISLKRLGPCFDIHTSDVDLIFPHHENEIAISETITGYKTVNYWIHNELVTMDGKKMPREPGRLVTFRALLDKGFSGREIRFWLIGAHYRRPIEFSIEALETSRKTLQRIDNFVLNLRKVWPTGQLSDIDQLLYNLKHGFFEAMSDDLNISGALAALFIFIRKVNPHIYQANLSRSDADRITEALSEINQILAVMEIDPEELDSTLQELIKRREQARARKDWGEADRIREELSASGIIMHDTPRGLQWKKAK